MIARREVIRLGLLSVTFHSCVGGVDALCGQGLRPRVRGCVLPRQHASVFMQSATDPHLYVSGKEPMISNSGDPDFDLALAHTLARLSDVFGVLPGFAYYDDRDGANALATAEARLRNADGTVLFGQRLLAMLLAGRESPEVAVAAVCAHEFGHILQFQRNLDRVVGKGQATVKRVELQADFFAGYFAGLRKRERPDFPAAVFALTQSGFGDTKVGDRDHHGTHEERGKAIEQGFQTAFRDQRSLADAIAISTEYVGRL
jgi:hypothetical protein